MKHFLSNRKAVHLRIRGIEILETVFGNSAKSKDRNIKKGEASGENHKKPEQLWDSHRGKYTKTAVSAEKHAHHRGNRKYSAD